MSSFDGELLQRLKGLEEQNLLRSLRTVGSPQQPRAIIEGRELKNFSSNDYLGLAADPRLKEAAVRAIERWGIGSGASRLITGSLQPHEELEESLSNFKNTEAALTFSSGYATALGTITALAGRGDVVVLDKLVHASIVDAARLSDATLRIFRHNDLNDLEEILRWADQQKRGQILVVTESLFSMDGDLAPLKEMAELKEKYGAWLMVDEAHGTGVFGANRRGHAEECGVSDRIDIQMGTLGKALGAAGGYIAGSRTLISYLINKARSFIFSTAPSPVVSAAATAAVEIASSAHGADLLRKLRDNIATFRTAARFSSAPHSPILPLMAGEEDRALQMAAKFREAGIFVPAIRYPSVARGKARLRFTVSSAHHIADVEAVVKVIASHD